MEYQPIRGRKIYEQVAEQIKGMIQSGKLKPGDKLASVRELSERFDVGRSAVREALSALRAMGLLEMRQGEGTYVKTFDPNTVSRPIVEATLMNQEQILELLEVRKIMEAGSAAICATEHDQEDLRKMEDALKEMEESLGASEELGEQADAKFHLAVAKGTKNNLLYHLMTTISGTMQEAMRESRRIWLYAEEETAERLYREHQAIYHAIKDRNATLAQQQMLAHLVKVEQVLRRFMEDKADEDKE
ncbi:FadR/GntR family transcriptional regulator [Melghirimyces algeriensis]|uniref:Transcriptional regulator, GntR family n=1 Tax=Melghirimyces algeriensis TaxID=910412 RepID=A0A521AJA9_9BACL|nr:FadR/GntR family transcriptional regulator [Melghirimyces algeriensis]SMO34873.1 transcriptional regulator, GntR family [Melghirimyces algeriensis]